MAEKTFHYFSFGSNLLRQRLQLKNPSARFKAVGELKDYKLSFSSDDNDPYQMRWKGGAATIVPHPGASVWGCIWTMGIQDIPSLDRQEIIYDAISVEVLPQNEDTKITCRTYILPLSRLTSKFDNRPSPHYIDVIIRGAVQNRMPEHYLQYLRSIETNGYSGSVPIYDEIIQSLKQTDSNS